MENQAFEQEVEKDMALEEKQDLQLSVLAGRNCRINIEDKHEIVRLNEELQEIQRWFEDYGRNGILFPASIISSNYRQAA